MLTLCLSADETAVYAVTSRGVFSAWSMYQSGQRMFEHRFDDPYFAQDTVYPRNCWGRQFSLAAGGRHILCCSTSGGVIYRFDSSKMAKVLGLKVRQRYKIVSFSLQYPIDICLFQGHKRHATCTDWSSANDCGPCVTAGFDGQIRVSTLLSQ